MKHTTPNSLIHETSPYLLQHAYNPVQWQPWGTQALEEARTTNRMLLVSIGYSSCHWCHVMEHESFEDAEVAALMNRHFVCIKVDREERSDVDQVFMDAVHLLGQRGGWPLNCVALPDGRPVWGGTYFRRDQWMGILMQLADLYEKQSPELFEQAEQLSQALINNRFVNNDTFKNVLSDALPVKMAESIAARLDPVHGGSRGAPKFPMPDNLLFLLLIAHKEGNNEMMQNVRHSLLQMASGGIYDQLAGGFSRYSVDERWHVPHFEKMLYDNAQLINLYATAYPLMIVSTISFATIKLFQQNSVYTYQLARRGELLTHNKDRTILNLMKVNKLIETDFRIIPPEYTLGELVQVIAQSKRNIFPVVDAAGQFMGHILMDDIRTIMFDTELYDTSVENLMVSPTFIIDPEDSMETVAVKFQESGKYNIPVLKNGIYLGYISRANVFSTYRQKLSEISDD
jgi:CBS domain-containing protein